MTDTPHPPTAWRSSRFRIAIWSLAALLWLAPGVAMLFTKEVVWGPLDFAVWGAMLGAACGTFELAARRTGSLAFRAATALAVGAAFLLTWINLAVGIVGDEGNPVNLAFFGVLAVGIAGGALGRFRPSALAWALLAMAAAQASLAVLALVNRWWSALILSGVFTGLWLLGAALYRTAARALEGAGA
jgi:hypothetical protein